MRSASVAGACRLTFLCLFIICNLAVHSQNFSGLLGKELLPEMETSQVVTSVFDRIRDGNLTGTITSVKVLDDQPLSLTVSVRFTGFSEGSISAVATDANRNVIKGFTPQKTPVEKDKKEVVIRISVDRSQYADNESFVAPKLLLTLLKADRNNGVPMLYKLDKKFTIPVRPENVIIPIKPIPVQSAAALPAALPSPTAVFELPHRKFKMAEKPLYYIYQPEVKLQSAEPAKPVMARENIPQQRVGVMARATMIDPQVIGRIPPPPPPPGQPERSTGTPPATQSTRPEGPVNNPVQLWGGFITADVDFESQSKITNVSLNLYPDKNEQSGVFYYLPIAYDVKFDKEKGFSFSIDYGTSRTESGENKVRMSGTLTSGISLFEAQFIQNMLQVFKQQNPQLKLEQALPMPIAETPTLTLSEDLRNFGITNVQISNTTSVSDPVEFSWHTDGTTASEIETLLKANSGIVGTMRIKPSGNNVPVQDIPLRIRLLDENTLGRFAITPSEFRTKNWRNEAPLPVKLKYLHVMIFDKNSDGKEGPIIYSWDLGNNVVPPLAQVKFDTNVVPSWLDSRNGKAARIWLDYAVVDTCNTCNEQIFRDIVRSTTKPQMSEVVFRFLPFFNDYNISFMDVQVKSVQGDPSATNEVLFPGVHVPRDSADYVGAKIYVPVGTEPSFEYRIVAVTKTGAEMTSQWIRRNSLSIPFGSHQLLELFPALNTNRQ